MQSKISIINLLFFIILFVACEQENESISYPTEGFFGENLLKHDSVKIEVHEDFADRSKAYSFRANIPEDKSVQVIIRQTHSQLMNRNWLYAIGNGNGWIYEDITGYARFQAFGQIVTDGRIQFTNTGSADIEIYENGAEEPTRVKSIAWELEE